MAGFLALSEKSAFPTIFNLSLNVSGSLWASHNGDNSSGYCSGLTPDSLLCAGGNTSTSPYRLQRYEKDVNMQAKTKKIVFFLLFFFFLY
jgi:hypothetical protein